MVRKMIPSTLLMIFFLVPLHFLCKFPTATGQQNPTYPIVRCNNTSNMTQPSPRFNKNLIYTIAVLTVKSQSELFHYKYSESYNFFTNKSGGSEPADSVYASYLCRGDISTKRCSNCVSQATDTATQNCFNLTKDAVVWNDVCTFRYSDRDFYGNMTELPYFVAFSDALNTTSFDVTKFVNALNNVTDTVAKLEDGITYGKKLATAVANVSGSKSVYALGECTWELLRGDCNKCIHDCIKMLPRGKTGGRVLFPSCNVRFETYQFYRVGANSEPDDNPLSPPIRPNPRDSAPPPRYESGSPRTNAENRPGGRRSYLPEPKRPSHVPEIASVGATLAAMILVISCVLFYAHKRKLTRQAFGDMEEITSADSLQIDFHKIRVATHNFAVDKKLGQGGFGEVFKGKLDNQVVAVKRLSRGSTQGIAEFKTEILLVAKLQHRNLVRLLGFCLSRKEKILVYEFLANSSLDRILFDPTKRETLSWETRFKIISGIAKGLLYLHEDSRLKIIHRDLKTSNILLDDFMNPKISDFGMAKLFGVDQTQDATKTIVGTYGYMAPEYMLTGQYSVKSDVYSFGIIILEIVTGLRNRYMNRPLLEEALLHRAWRLWNEGSVFELVDYVLGDAYSREEVIKCIHIGLLCIQEDASRRPKMTWVLAAIRGEANHFPAPTPPNFFNSIRSSSSNTGTSTDQGASSSTAREPLTELHAR